MEDGKKPTPEQLDGALEQIKAAGIGADQLYMWSWAKSMVENAKVNAEEMRKEEEDEAVRDNRPSGAINWSVEDEFMSDLDADTDNSRDMVSFYYRDLWQMLLLMGVVEDQ